jgi:hypothetical protein
MAVRHPACADDRDADCRRWVESGTSKPIAKLSCASAEKDGLLAPAKALPKLGMANLPFGFELRWRTTRNGSPLLAPGLSLKLTTQLELFICQQG